VEEVCAAQRIRLEVNEHEEVVKIDIEVGMG
jgi:hypothetical protein